MKWAIAIAAFLAGMAVDYFLIRPNVPQWVRHRPDLKDAKIFSSEDNSKKWEGGLETFGIKSGDLLISVNNIKDQSMFQELVDGYNRGKVCVLYERDEKKREVCWERK